jgi:hypothetical protein
MKHFLVSVNSEFSEYHHGTHKHTHTHTHTPRNANLVYIQSLHQFIYDVQS